MAATAAAIEAAAVAATAATGAETMAVAKIKLAQHSLAVLELLAALHAAPTKQWPAIQPLALHLLRR